MKNIEKLKWLMKNDSGEWRNGWWMVIFVVLVALSRPLFSILKSTLDSWGAGPEITELLPVGLILAITYICLKLRRESLYDVGLHFDKRAISLFAKGLFLAALQVSFIMGTIYLTGGAEFEWNQSLALTSLIGGFYLVLLTAAFEEILFRGFVFQRLIGGIGIISAQLLAAILFSVGHWDNPEMDGLIKAIASLNLALGSLVLGLAYYKTKSLFMPLGVHLSWNFVMGQIYGAGVSGLQHEGVLETHLNNAAIWLTGGKFGPEASILTTIAELAVLLVIYKWDALKPKSPEEIEVDTSNTGGQESTLTPTR